MATTSITHDLQQFRYVTSPHQPLPWPHVRHACIPELRNEPPDLPLMTHLISALSGCDMNLREIREHNNADVLQLVEVLQACLQFTLWSQNILKEKMLELQSAQVARRVSARQLDTIEARYKALEKEVAALTGERDTLSLGTANLRTSLVQMETTVKMQERQIKQERERTSQLLAKLEKALAENAATTLKAPPPLSSVANADVRWLKDTKGRLCCPTCGHRRHRSNARAASSALNCKEAHRETRREMIIDDAASCGSTSDTATSYSDSLMNAEGEVWRRCQGGNHHGGMSGAGNIFPSPGLDWRTLVRYIIHEEKRTPTWPTPAAPPAAAKEEAAIPAAATADTVAPAAPPSLPSELASELQALMAHYTAAVVEELSDYARSTAAQTRAAVADMTRQQVLDFTEAQRSLVKDIRSSLRGTPPALSLPAIAAAVPMTLPVVDSPVTNAASAAAAAASWRTEAAKASPSAPAEAADGRPAAPPMRPQPSSSTNTKSSPLMKSADTPDEVRGKTSTAASQPRPSLLSASSSSPAHERYDYGGLGGAEAPSMNSLFASPYRTSQPPSLFNSPSAAALPARASVTGSPNSRYNASGTVRASLNQSRASSLPAFSPDILRTPPSSEHDTPPATASSASSDRLDDDDARYGVADMHDDEDGQSPDADFRLPTSPSSSPTESYQSSSDGPVVVRERKEATHAAPAAFSAKLNTSFHSPPAAKPVTTPPVHPGLTALPSGSPLTASATPGGFSLYRTVSLQSSMRSDASGGSTHASSQMLRDTQRELEALMAEDAAAERAKKQH